MKKSFEVFDALRFLEDFRIDHKTRGHKHCSDGWVQIVCPFCKGNPGYHLGFHLATGTANCRRCGKKKRREVLVGLIGNNPQLLSQVTAKYRAGVVRAATTNHAPLRKGSVRLPPGIVETIPKRAENYLLGRGYDPKVLEEVWKVKFTGPSGSYKFRIIAPVYHEGRLVSYQGRDYTDKADLRYKACRQEDEARDHKECLYGSWLVTGNRVGVVEGITDAWRMGAGCVATFGIAYTLAQIKLLAQFKRIVIIYDSEPQAIYQATVLSNALKLLNPSIDIQIVELDGGDPGELPQKEADYLMKSLL